jgi:hypothetical protein
MDTAWLLYIIKGLCIDRVQANPFLEAEGHCYKATSTCTCSKRIV